MQQEMACQTVSSNGASDMIVIYIADGQLEVPVVMTPPVWEGSTF
jgi:hypothetical protein